MRHDIYYVLENWAPSLAKNKIYQALIKDIISAKETFRVKEIDNENTYIDLKHTEYQKVIRVDTIEQDSEKSEEEQKKKIEYGCFVDKENSQTFTATVANNTDAEINVEDLDIVLKNGDTVVATLYGYLGEPLAAGESRDINASIGMALTKDTVNNVEYTAHTTE